MLLMGLPSIGDSVSKCERGPVGERVRVQRVSSSIAKMRSVVLVEDEMHDRHCGATNHRVAAGPRALYITCEMHARVAFHTYCEHISGWQFRIARLERAQPGRSGSKPRASRCHHFSGCRSRGTRQGGMRRSGSRRTSAGWWWWLWQRSSISL